MHAAHGRIWLISRCHPYVPNPERDGRFLRIRLQKTFLRFPKLSRATLNSGMELQTRRTRKELVYTRDPHS